MGKWFGFGGACGSLLTVNFGSPAAVMGEVSWWCSVVTADTIGAENIAWREVTSSAGLGAKMADSVAKTCRLLRERTLGDQR